MEPSPRTIPRRFVGLVGFGRQASLGAVPKARSGRTRTRAIRVGRMGGDVASDTALVVGAFVLRRLRPRDAASVRSAANRGRATSVAELVHRRVGYRLRDATDPRGG